MCRAGLCPLIIGVALRTPNTAFLKCTSRELTCFAANLQVWCDEHKRSREDNRYLSIWEPVPPAGYAAVGLLASVGPQPPPLSAVRCVRWELQYILRALRMLYSMYAACLACERVLLLCRKCL